MQETLKLYTKLQLTSKSWGLLQESLRLYRKNLTEYYIISWIKRVSRLVLTYDLLENRRLFNITINYFLLCYHTKKRFHDAVGLHSNRSQETWKCGKNITISCASCATFLFLPQFGVICDLLLNRPTAFVNLFVKRRPNLTHMFDFLSAYSIFFFLTHSCRGWWGWMRLL